MVQTNIGLKEGGPDPKKNWNGPGEYLEVQE